LKRGLGDADGARADLEASLDVRRRLGSRQTLSLSLGKLAPLVAAHDPARARALALEAHSLACAIESQSAIAHARRAQGEVARLTGRRDEARAWLREAVVLEHRADTGSGLVFALEELAALEAEERDHALAAWLLGAALGLRETLGLRVSPVDPSGHARWLEACREALGPRELEARLAEGRSLDPASVVRRVGRARPRSRAR
jgi:hypothetical protein